MACNGDALAASICSGVLPLPSATKPRLETHRWMDGVTGEKVMDGDDRDTKRGYSRGRKGGGRQVTKCRGK